MTESPHQGVRAGVVADRPSAIAARPTPGRAPRGTLGRLAASAPIRLALLAFFIYNVNLRSISSYDTYPARLLPVSLLTELDLDLDEFSFLHEPRLTGPEPIPYFVTEARGHLMSKYPVLPALLATPVYAVPVALGVHRGRPLAPGISRVEVVATLLSKIAASLALAASVALVFLTLVRLTDRRPAIAITLIYAFATSTWSVSSQGLWQNAFSQPLLALALYAFVRARDSDVERWIAVAGWALALTVACRPPLAIVALVLSVYALRYHRPQLLRFAVGPVIVGGLLLAYNLYYFDSPIGGYGGLPGSYEFAPTLIASRLYGLLLSPNRGMLVFSPILAASMAGMWTVLAARARPRDHLFTFVAVATILMILHYATYSIWHGAFGFSYRFLTELLPALALFFVPVWRWLVATRARLAFLGAVVAYSVCVQVIGAFYYPCGWYRAIPDERALERRFHDWNDVEMLQCVRAGPVDPDGLRAIRRVLGIPGGGREAR